MKLNTDLELVYGMHYVCFTLFSIHGIPNSIYAASITVSNLKFNFWRYVPAIIQFWIIYSEEVKKEVKLYNNNLHCYE